MNKQQVNRMNNINKLIIKIGHIDRKFFNSSEGSSEFIELKTTVKFRDAVTRKSISIPAEGRVRWFSHGGTLLALVRDFKRYILTGVQCDYSNNSWILNSSLKNEIKRKLISNEKDIV